MGGRYVQNLLRVCLTHAHNCHTDLDFLWPWCVCVCIVGMAFLLSVLEKLLIQLTHTHTHRQMEAGVAHGSVACFSNRGKCKLAKESS